MCPLGIYFSVKFDEIELPNILLAIKTAFRTILNKLEVYRLTSNSQNKSNSPTMFESFKTFNFLSVQFAKCIPVVQ